MYHQLAAALLEESWQVRLKEFADGFVTSGDTSLVPSREDGELFLLQEISFTKADDHTDTTYYGYELDIDGVKVGDKTERMYHSRTFSLENKVCRHRLKIIVSFPTSNAATRVDVRVVYKVFRERMIPSELTRIS